MEDDENRLEERRLAPQTDQYFKPVPEVPTASPTLFHCAPSVRPSVSAAPSAWRLDAAQGRESFGEKHSETKRNGKPPWPTQLPCWKKQRSILLLLQDSSSRQLLHQSPENNQHASNGVPWGVLLGRGSPLSCGTFAPRRGDAHRARVGWSVHTAGGPWKVE